MNGNKGTTCLVFTLSTPLTRVAEFINSLGKTGLVVCLTSHQLFESEQISITQRCAADISFRSFYEFIDEEGMVHCDVEADKQICDEQKTRDHQIFAYYDRITALKNQMIMREVYKEYSLESCYLLADDLGVHAATWGAGGAEFVNLDKNKPVDENAVVSKSWFGERIKCKFKEYVPVQCLRTPEGCYYFMGRVGRIKQYLDMDQLSFKPLTSLHHKAVCFVFNTSDFSHRRRIFVGAVRLLNRLFCQICRIYEGKERYKVIAPIHEIHRNFGAFAVSLGTEMICLQDGYLPGFYPSAYLKYRPGITRYYIWDKLSKSIFEQHGLVWNPWPYFKTTALKLLEPGVRKICHVVVLTSGAGDWTALKSRSDEDLAFQAFVDVARRLPQVHIRYRPHPIWMHPRHQGVHSIQRLVDCARELNLPNFSVSAGALDEGRAFSLDGNLSAKPTSVNEEIEQADIVFGDHSQALLRAGQDGKIFVSVSCARRRPFFEDYARLGFPVLRSGDDIVAFIRGLEESPDTVNGLNTAIAHYNENFAFN